MSEERPPGSWYAVVMKAQGFTALGSALTRRGSFPDADYGTRCCCCNAETTTRLMFNPSASHAASSVAIPRCKDCADHIAASNSMALMGLLGGAVLVVIGVMSYWPLAVLGGLCTAAMGAFVLLERNKRAAMQKAGHCTGLEIVAIPGLVSVRTTNVVFADALTAQNPEIATRPRG